MTRFGQDEKVKVKGNLVEEKVGRGIEGVSVYRDNDIGDGPLPGNA